MAGLQRMQKINKVGTYSRQMIRRGDSLQCTYGRRSGSCRVIDQVSRRPGRTRPAAQQERPVKHPQAVVCLEKHRAATGSKPAVLLLSVNNTAGCF